MIKLIKKHLYIFLLLMLVFAGGIELKAQDADLDALFHQREILFKNAEEYYGKNTAFFGGKSRRDLMLIIGELEKIIAMDNRIIDEVQRRRQHVEKQRDTIQQEKYAEKYINYRLESTLLDYNKRILDLENANGILRDQLTKTREENEKQKASLSKSQQQAGLLTLMLIILLLGLTGYTGYYVYIHRLDKPFITKLKEIINNGKRSWPTN